MKKFRFSLDTVLEYKTQILEDLKKEHSLMLRGIKDKEDEIALLEQERASLIDQYNLKKQEGIRIPDALSYETHIIIMQKKIDEQILVLQKLIKQAELKQLEIVEVNVEVASYEKLREKHLDQYNKMEQKAQETFIDEFVSYKRSVTS